MNVGVIGLGKLGLPTAMCFAAAGHRVAMYDVDEKRRQDVKAWLAGNGPCPVPEPLMADLEELAENPVVNNTADATAAISDVIFVVVPTPSKRTGDFDTSYLTTAFDAMEPGLRDRERFVTIVCVSTVSPGTCVNVLVPHLEKMLGGPVEGERFGFVYNPEFIALGNVVDSFMWPDVLLLGGVGTRAMNAVDEVYRTVLWQKGFQWNQHSDRRVGVYSHMGYTSAEITKLSLNCYCTLKISFANTVAAVCEKFPGADVDDVLSAVGADSRVGTKFLRAGTPFGGPCFPRDGRALQHAVSADAEHAIIMAPQDASDTWFERVIAGINMHPHAKGAKAVIVGMPYKCGTPVMDESASVTMLEELRGLDYQVVQLDPYVAPGDAKLVCTGAALVVLMLPDRLVVASMLDEVMLKGGLVVDPWRQLAYGNWTRVDYWGLGLGPKEVLK